MVDAGLGIKTKAVPYTVEHDIPTRMSDGITLLGDLYQPVSTKDPAPVVLMRCPYGRRGAIPLTAAIPLARRGFQVFLQSTRGTFGSEGTFRPFFSEKDDGITTLAWLRSQPWCDGQVAMAGSSYLGHTQWAVAPYADPPLAAVSLSITSADLTKAFFTNGAPGVLNALSWAALLGTQESAKMPAALNPRFRKRTERIASTGPFLGADVALSKNTVPFWQDFLDLPATDPAWSEVDHSRADMTAMPPVTMVTGWWDLFLAGQLADFMALRAAGNDARITIGPWSHSTVGAGAAAMRDSIAWLGHHLNGAPMPQRTPVRALLQNTDIWLDLEQWPPSNRVDHDRYLLTGGRIESTPSDSGALPSTFVYDPADPTPTVGGPMLSPPAGQADNTAVERRTDVLVFTADPEPVDLDIVGPVTATIYVRPQLAHADIFVRLCDVDTKNRSFNIVDGIKRLNPQSVPACDARDVGDGVLAVDVELFPTAYRVEAGHRLRVQIAGGASPRYASNTGTGEALTSTAAGVAGTVEIFHDSDHPSHITLPVLT
ncbi:CocE/NonD family hydrolase [Rhodococcoides yunnanense]|uniref:CocE/NonD family hydrolase n=1 Tax=Rhodococcoides yunnanense TaxID=278209 RepID=A0ABU4BKA7_9NOCA|nr:CocE/NonD family hydrolase [Rhodococcus yunnanensis]MDV6264658.1 CocE/NonD family hydrolase [Rhodococcus yunnanensis]